MKLDDTNLGQSPRFDGYMDFFHIIVSKKTNKTTVEKGLRTMIRNLLLSSIIIASALWLIACDETNTSTALSGNFTTEVSGSIKGKISGPGVITYLPPSEASFGSRPGYFFIADDTGVRELGITFSIPSKTTPGTYQLKSAHPIDIGKEFEVRLDKSTENQTVSFRSNTKGSITLEEFPSDPNKVAGSIVKGTFNLSAENSSGERVTATGAFEFWGR